MHGNLWITGVCGFTGRHSVAELRAGGDAPRIIGLDLGEAGPAGVDAYHRVDVTDPGQVAEAARIDAPAWVIHLAGAIPPTPEPEMWRANVGGTVGLLTGLAASECRGVRVVAIGSAAEYAVDAKSPLEESAPGGGSSAYGRIKWAQTLVALQAGREFGLATLVARPFNLVGPGLPESLVAGALSRQFAVADDESVIRVGNTRSSRDFVDVRDAVMAYWQIARSARPGEIYNVCTGRAVTIDRVIALLCQLIGRSPRIETNPERLREGDPPASYGSPAKLERATGWKPRIDLQDSLADMVADLADRVQ